MTKEQKQQLRDRNAELHLKYCLLAKMLLDEKNGARTIMIQEMMLDVELARNDLLSMFLIDDGGSD